MKWNKFWVKEAGKEYDEARRQAAGQKAVLYYLAALYIGYMGYSILNNRLSGDDTLTYPIAILLTLAFMLGAIWIAWYATRRMKNEFDNSVIESENQEDELK